MNKVNLPYVIRVVFRVLWCLEMLAAGASGCVEKGGAYYRHFTVFIKDADILPEKMTYNIRDIQRGNLDRGLRIYFSVFPNRFKACSNVFDQRMSGKGR